MKKKILKIGIPSIIVILIIGLLSFNIINKETNSNENQFENLKGKKIITTTSTMDKLLDDEFITLAKNSDAVIKGKVISVNYEAIEGNAWTKIKFHINNVITGNIKENIDIDIYYIGGYITLEDHIKYNDDAFRFKDLSEDEIKNTIFKEVVDGEENFVKKGEELILCIVKTSESSPLPKNSYERLYAAGMLKEKDNKYVQLYGEVEEKYSIAKDKVSSIKNMLSQKS